MEEGLQSVEDLQAALLEYKLQLEQVETLLRSEPGNTEAQEMQQQLLDVMQLTEELIQMSATSADATTSADPAANGASSADENLTAEPLPDAEASARESRLMDPAPPTAPGSPREGPGRPIGSSEEADGAPGPPGGSRDGPDLSRDGPGPGRAIDHPGEATSASAGTEGSRDASLGHIDCQGDLGTSLGHPGGSRDGRTVGAVGCSGEAAGALGPPEHHVAERIGAMIGPTLPAAREDSTNESEGRGRKRGRRGAMHPRNKYAELAPDFDQLADKYPSLRPYVMGPRGGRRSVEWTDFNATRELTRALLHHDYGVTWDLPDGHLCPTVTNRANYIHWIEDLLSLFPRPSNKRATTRGAVVNDPTENIVAGIDIGTGANCIYPLLGASLNGWRFVGTDITDAALDTAQANIEANPHLSHLIKVCDARWSPRHIGSAHTLPAGEEPPPGVLVGVVGEAECFDFCMCNPPFFEHMDEAGANPRTACGGTEFEMVCEGGEDGFIRRIIADSLVLKDKIHWYTTMVGRKVNLKTLTEFLRKSRVPTVRTTEFVQGRTSRWGLAWSFSPEPSRDLLQLRSGATRPPRSKLSFTLEGLGRHCQASDVLLSLASTLTSLGASCSPDPLKFTLGGSAPVEIETQEAHGEQGEGVGHGARFAFQVSIFQQAPGALSVAASLVKDVSTAEGSEAAFSSLFERAEAPMRNRFQPSHTRC